MDLADLIAPEAVYPSLKAKSKKQALHEVAQKAAVLTGLAARSIFDTLLQRERLGSTGVGRGIAIPHGRLAALPRIVSVFARLDEPIEFEALDGEPVDLIFLLLPPEHAGPDHLKALDRTPRLRREPPTHRRPKPSEDPAALSSVLTDPAVHAAERPVVA